MPNLLHDPPGLRCLPVAMRMVTLRDAKSMTLRPKSANLTVKPNGF